MLNLTKEVVSPKQKKAICKIVYADRETLITDVVSAIGSSISSMFIPPRKRKKPELLNDSSIASVVEVSGFGYMNTDIFQI